LAEEGKYILHNLKHNAKQMRLYTTIKQQY